jgi:hypothetical protein
MVFMLICIMVTAAIFVTLVSIGIMVIWFLWVLWLFRMNTVSMVLKDFLFFSYLYHPLILPSVSGKHKPLFIVTAGGCVQWGGVCGSLNTPVSGLRIVKCVNRV